MDHDVGEQKLLGIAFLGLASVFPEPVVHGAPVADGEDHTVLEVVGHLGVGTAVTGHLDGVGVLGHRGGEGAELVARLDEVQLGVEGAGGVDAEAAAGAVGVVVQLANVVLPAGASTVAEVVVALVGGSVAGVRGGLVGVLVGLHDVELGAVVAVDLVSVAVVVPVSVPVVATGVLAGRGNEVESRDAAAYALAQVNVVLHGAAKQVGGVELFGVKSGRLGQVASFVRWHHNGAVVGPAGSHGHVQGDGEAVFDDGDGGPAVLETVVENLGLEGDNGGGKAGSEEALHSEI